MFVVKTPTRKMIAKVIMTPTPGILKSGVIGVPKAIRILVKTGDNVLSNFLKRKLRMKKVNAIGTVTNKPAIKVFLMVRFKLVNTENHG